MTRSTRSGRLTKGNAKPDKENPVKKPSQAKKSKASTSDAYNEEHITPTPTRSLRKRGNMAVETEPTSSSKSKATTSVKRRRVSSPTGELTVPAPVNDSAKSMSSRSTRRKVTDPDVIVEEASKKIEDSQPTRSAPRLQTTSGKRKAESPLMREVVKSVPMTADFRHSSKAEAKSKRPRSSTDSQAVAAPSTPSPKRKYPRVSLTATVLVRPLSTNTQVDISATSEVTDAKPAPIDSTTEEKGQPASKAHPKAPTISSSLRVEIEPLIDTTTANLTVTVAPNHQSAQVPSTSDAVANSKPLANGTTSHSVVKPKVSHIPTKAELEAECRRVLLQRVDHYDLSDFLDPAEIFHGWPTSDSSAASGEDILLPERRIWISRSSNPRTSAPNGIPAAGPSALNNGDQLEAANSHCVALHSNSQADPAGIAGFKIASIGPPNAKDNRTDASQADFLLPQVRKLNADVVCFHNVMHDCAVGVLLPAMLRLGYSAADQTYQNVSQDRRVSLICHRMNMFTEVAVHHLQVQKMARTVVNGSAYSQAWRNALINALNSPASSSSDSGPELVVSVLRHNQSRTQFLVGCLSADSSSNSPLFGYTQPSVPHASANKADTGCSPTSNSDDAATGVSTSADEWHQPTPNCRPDLMTINVTGAFWCLTQLWQETLYEPKATVNGGTLSSNGYDGEAAQHSSSQTSAPAWILCTNLEASPSSPVYQICKDGYPTDDSLAKLRTIRTVRLENPTGLLSQALIDFLWPAFQHPCPDVVSCYKEVMGRDPPFTRDNILAIAKHPTSASGIGRCVDYIWCSGDTLRPEAVLLPPCRAMVAASGQETKTHPTSPSDACARSAVIPLVAQLSLLSATEIRT